MKKIILFAICAAFALVTNAQTTTDELQYLQNVIGMKKKQYVEEHLKVNPADATKFWALYDEYELFRGEIGERRVANISEYAKYYTNLTDAKADELTKKSFAVNEEQDKLLQKTYTKMAKEINPLLASRFVQVELYLEALVRKAVTEQIPVMFDSDKKK